MLQKQGKPAECRDRVGVYLQGNVGMRPLIDLNSYYVLVMNADPTISVYYPIIGITGKTNLYAQVILKRAGADWVKTRDDKRLYVSMPVADAVAVVDTEKFVVVSNLPAGERPTRVVMQPDQKYLWVGNDAQKPDASGVTVLDLENNRTAKFIATGGGHHEIVVSPDSRRAYVTNRDDGTVTVIDVASLEILKTLKTGTLPISIAFSEASDSLYVADGKSGRIQVIGGAEPEIVARIESKPGLGPVRFSEDGRWGVAVNTNTDEAYVIDPATNALRRTLPVKGRPYHVAFSPAFAYVRALDSERVTMIQLDTLDQAGPPAVITFPAGAKAPGLAANLSIADTMVAAPGEAAMMVVNPADNTIYYYMEGMNAPMGAISDPALRRSGHQARAVTVADRTLRENAPGVYASRIKIPAAGKFTVAFLLDSPRLLHCFTFTAKPNPLLERDLDPIAIEYLTEDRFIPVGETVPVRFRLTDPATQAPPAELDGVRLLYYAASGQGRTTVAARPLGEGVYEADVRAPWPGAYYVWVSAPSLDVKYQDLPYFSLRAMRKPGTAAASPGPAPQ
jgi:YVTN family beta-propeller protein